jgi:hypothetical protein
MRRRVLHLLAAICIVLSPALAAAQGEPPPRPLRYVSELEVPHNQWAEYEVYADKNIRPTLERLMAQGTMLGWGVYRSILNQDGMRTHGIWFEVPTIDGMENVLGDLAKLPPSPVPASAKHHDYLYRAQLRHAKSGSGTGGYLFVNTTQIQEGKRQQWREWWDKYQKPNYEQYLAEGLVTSYELVVEEIHHAGPNWVYLIYTTPSAAALDKLNATFSANSAKRTPDENRAINDALDLTVVPVGHQDYIARALAYAQR